MNKYQVAFNEVKEHITSKHHWWSTQDKRKHLATLQELVDKETPMKPPLKWECAKPQTRCKCSAGVERYNRYCWNCGQKLDWSDTDD